jgi:hypothetical protein
VLQAKVLLPSAINISSLKEKGKILNAYTIKEKSTNNVQFSRKCYEKMEVRKGGEKDL